MIWVYMKEQSSWSEGALDAPLLVDMKLMPMALCSHCCAAPFRALQIGAISVNTPLILGHSLAHSSCRWRLPQNTKIESTWDMLWIKGTINCPSAPEMIIHTFSWLLLLVMNSMHSSPPVKILTALMTRRNCANVFWQSVFFSSMLLSNQMRRTFWTLEMLPRWRSVAPLCAIQLCHGNYVCLLTRKDLQYQQSYYL